MKLSILAGSTSQSVNVFIQDSSSITGAGKTGLVFNTSGLTAYYSHSGANATGIAITLANLASVNTGWVSGGFTQLDVTNMPGWYRFDIPNAVLATNKGRSVAIHLQGAAGMAPCPIEIELTGWDNQDSIRGGMTAFPNAVAGAAGGLVINGTNSGTIVIAALTISGATTLTGNVSMAAGLTITQSVANSSAVAITGNGTGHGISVTSGSGATGNGINISTSATNGNGVSYSGSGTGDGLRASGGTTGRGIHALGGATSGGGFRAEGSGANANGFESFGIGTGAGWWMSGGVTGPGASLTGGATSGAGFVISTTNGDGLSIIPTAGNAIVATGNGTSKHGAVFTGGTAGVSDGLKAVAGTGGVDVRGNITGNITGSVGSVASTVLKKNIALANFEFMMTDSTNHAPATTKTVSCTRSIDGGAFAAGTLANVAEIAFGMYRVDFGTADLNGNVITLRATATGCDDTLITLTTSP